MEDKIIISKRLKEVIKNCNINQKTIAKHLNISESNITNWKRGGNLPSIEILRKLCLLLDEDANYILGLDIKEDGSKIEINNSFNNNSGSINFKG